MRFRVIAVMAMSLKLSAMADGRAVVNAKPAALRVDSLVEPLGIDTARPLLSWQLRDTRHGAKQTAYEIEVYTKAPRAVDARADVGTAAR